MSQSDPEIIQKPLSWFEQNLFGRPIDQLPGLIPGIIAAVVLAWLSKWLSNMIGIDLLGFEKSPISPIMLALVLGIVLGSIVSIPKIFQPGFIFVVKKILKLGIILLGIRLTIFDVFKLGSVGIPIVMICILSALLITVTISRWIKLPERLGVLIAVGTSICGVSAILAAGPAINAEEEESAYAVAVITVFGLLATLFYPYLMNTVFAGNPVSAGLFLGTSVHDTSQVVAAATVYADVYGQSLTLDVATVTKLVRNVFMALVIPAMAYYYNRRSEGDDTGEKSKTNILNLLPLFVMGFISLAVIRSIGDAGINTGSQAFGLWRVDNWNLTIGYIKSWAANFLLLALAGVGLTTDIKSIKGLGIKPFLAGLGAALAVGAVSYLAIILLGRYVIF